MQEWWLLGNVVVQDNTTLTYLRSTMGQERLSGLAILSIENIRAQELDIKDIVEDFAQRKARHMPLQ